MVSRILLLLIGIGFGCSSNDDIEICDSNSGIILEFGSCLVFEDNGALDSERAAIEKVVREAVPLVNNKMPVENLKITVRAAPSDVIPEIGIGGYNPNPQEVIISMDPGFPDLTNSIATELAAQLAHEMHHAKRRRTVGYGSTLLEACISEGLADCFSMEVTGIDPPIWSTALSGQELEDWIDIASATWTNRPYDHPKWFVGASAEVPRWAGYSIGFKLVKDYLSDNPKRKASDLVGEPAGSFAE